MKLKEFVRLAERNGWKQARQSGSHRIYQKGDKKVVIPYHCKELKKGLEIALRKEMGLK